MTFLYPTRTAALSLTRSLNEWRRALRNLVIATIAVAMVGAAAAEDGVTKDEILVGATSIDKGIFSYAVMWNAFKRLCAGASAAEKEALLSGTATAFYRLENLN